MDLHPPGSAADSPQTAVVSTEALDETPEQQSPVQVSTAPEATTPAVTSPAPVVASVTEAPPVATPTSDGKQMSVEEAVEGVAPAPTPSSCEPTADGQEEVPAGPLELIAGFDQPVAVIHDTSSDVYLVSNLNTRGADHPGKGYISRVSPTGEVEALKWLDGAAPKSKLTAPRGMAIIANRLYVTDGTVIRVYDRRSAKPRGTIKVAGATQLNGLSLGPSSSLFVADSSFTAEGYPARSDAVYRVNRAGHASALFRSSVLGHPSAVVRVDGVVWIATQGSGKLYGLESDGYLNSGPDLPDGRLSGMVPIGDDDVIVTSWAGDAIYRGSLMGRFEYFRGGISLPGHPAWDKERRRLLVPSQGPGTVHVMVLDPLDEKKASQG